MKAQANFRWLSIAAITILSMVALAISGNHSTLAQGGSTDTPTPDSAYAQAPAYIRANVPVVAAGAAASDTQKELVGPYQLLKSGTVDLNAGTVTMPLYQGSLSSGEKVWYALFDVSDQSVANALGLNFSAKLANADLGKAVRPAHLDAKGAMVFERGRVDFSPKLSITPGDAPNYFPPKAVQPGSVGDANYSPLAKVGSVIYNAPMVAFNVDASKLNFCDGNPDYDLVLDKVVAICPAKGTVTFLLTEGFAFGRPLLYVSTDANNPLPATMEKVTYAPAMKDIPVGGGDSPLSAVQRIFPIVNGPMGKDNPQRQGFDSALNGEGAPLNTTGGIPSMANDYSPLWDVNAGQWTQAAIDKGYRSRLTDEYQILGFASEGWITGPGGKPFGSTGLLVDCPVVYRVY